MVYEAKTEAAYSADLTYLRLRAIGLFQLSWCPQVHDKSAVVSLWLIDISLAEKQLIYKH